MQATTTIANSSINVSSSDGAKLLVWLYSNPRQSFYHKSFNQGASLMKAPFRSVRNFSRSNSGALWPHQYFLKGFYSERFRTRLVRLSRLLVLRM